MAAQFPKAQVVVKLHRSLWAYRVGLRWETIFMRPPCDSTILTCKGLQVSRRHQLCDRMRARSSAWFLAMILSVCGVIWMPRLGSAATTDPHRPAAWLIEDRAVAASQLESEATLSALYRAILLRRSLDEPLAASADVDRFLSRLADRPRSLALTDDDQDAVESFFEYVLSDEPWMDSVAWTSALRRLIALLRDRNQPALLLRAEVRLAAYLWKQSCPIDGQDGACIVRKDADSVCRFEQDLLVEQLHRQYPTARVYRSFEDIPYYQYTVIGRNERIATEAQRVLREALARIKMTTIHHSSPVVREAVQHARFLMAEPAFERALATQAWPGAPASMISDKARQRTYVNGRFKRWLDSRVQFTTSSGMKLNRYSKNSQCRAVQFSNYADLVGDTTSRWAAAAQSRLGTLILDAGNQTVGCIEPTVSFREERSDYVFSHKSFNEQEIPELFTDAAKQHFAACNQAAQALLVDDAIVRFCVEANDKVSLDLLRVYEILPGANMPIFMTLNGLR